MCAYHIFLGSEIVFHRAVVVFLGSVIVGHQQSVRLEQLEVVLQPSVFLEPRNSGLLELLVPSVAGRMGLCVVALVVHEALAHGVESGIETSERDRRVEVEKNGDSSFSYNS